MTNHHDTPSVFDRQNAAIVFDRVSDSILLALIESKQTELKENKPKTLLDFLRRIGLIP